MGKRVHVAKRYEIKYAGVEGFNWKEDEFIDLLGLFDGSVCRYQNEDGSAGDFEVSKEGYKKALDALTLYVKDPAKYDSRPKVSKMDWPGAEDIADYIKNTEYEPQELLELMQAYWREADKRDGWLHFASW